MTLEIWDPCTSPINKLPLAAHRGEASDGNDIRLRTSCFIVSYMTDRTVERGSLVIKVLGGKKRGTHSIPGQENMHRSLPSKTKGLSCLGYEYFHSELGAVLNALTNKDSLASDNPDEALEPKHQISQPLSDML